jgi:peptide/nickel transport system ATP-binding protein
MSAERVLTVENLRVDFETRRGPARAVDGVSLSIDRGEVLGVVGESGSGKSVSALAIMRLVAYPGRVVAGRIDLNGRNVLELSSSEVRELRGKDVAMIFQDPGTTLNPVLRIGDQMTEVLRYRGGMGRREADARAQELLETVQLPEARKRLRMYPHELSGGMQQRVVIAIALALRPRLLLADEPTTALDVTVQAGILDLIDHIRDETRSATMMISHDIGVINQTSDRVAVMYAGKIVESGRTADVIGRPAHPYTQGLLGAVPRVEDCPASALMPIAGGVPDIVKLPSGCSFHPRCPFAMEVCRTVEPTMSVVGDEHVVSCHLFDASASAGSRPLVAEPKRRPASPAREDGESAKDSLQADPILRVENLVKDFPARRNSGLLVRRQTLRAVDRVSFTVGRGEALGLVGETGCGKSTTARMIMGLIKPTSGQVVLDGVDLDVLPRAQLIERRRLLQMVFQNAYASLDPRWTVERLVAEPLEIHEGLSRDQREERVLGLLSTVAMGRNHLGRYPHQLSGGQRQRVAIARATALDARLLVADEPVSSLDVSVQAQILELLLQLKEELGLAMLLISHNLAVVNYLCERVAVMYAGQIVEYGKASRVLHAPRHPYTQLLIASIPDPTVKASRKRLPASGDPPLQSATGQNCPFHNRCPHAREICRTQAPPEVPVSADQVARCHLVASGEL